jgi:hypothetical protein
VSVRATGSPIWIAREALADIGLFDVSRETATLLHPGALPCMRLQYGVADVQSSIIANNGGGSAPVNIGLGIGGGVSGANNLIGESGTVGLPPDTIQADPQLLPLGDHGGPTRTHALEPTSQAIDAGNNAVGGSFDQRGTGFPRVVGFAADIGAFESDSSSDAIFADGFD